jgi:fluoride ion exporter CrcB/FEX
VFETHRLTEEGDIALAVANIAVSLIVGVGAAELGRLIA